MLQFLKTRLYPCLTHTINNMSRIGTPPPRPICESIERLFDGPVKTDLQTHPEHSTFTHRGVECIIRMHNRCGTWAGYAKIPVDHARYNKREYWNSRCWGTPPTTPAGVNYGEVTYVDDNIIGFDLLHRGIYKPFICRHQPEDEVYVSWDEVKKQTERMADWLLDNF